MSLLKILIYTPSPGKVPYLDWENGLDKKTNAIIKNKIERIRIGNFGDAKIIKDGEGVWELRIDYRPGYRIYFGKKGTTIIILLTGGKKKSQSRDIEKAKRYLLECKESL